MPMSWSPLCSGTLYFRCFRKQHTVLQIGSWIYILHPSAWLGSLFSLSSPAFLVCTHFLDGLSKQCILRLLCCADLHFPLACLAENSVCVLFSWRFHEENTYTLLPNCIILEILLLFICFKCEYNLPFEICFLQFCLSFRSSSLPCLNIFLDVGYHLYLCRSLNCLLLSSILQLAFFVSWPPNHWIASGPILVLRRQAEPLFNPSS